MLQVPNEPFLRELYGSWKIRPESIYVRDPRIDRNFTLDTLLRDVLQARDEILSSLSEHSKQRLLSPHEDVFICVLASPGYRFVVEFLALFSIGAVTVPLSPFVLSEEAQYFLRLCDAVALLSSKEHADRAGEISDLASVATIVLSESSARKTQEQLELSTAPSHSLDKMATLLYTSGTTGKPKGVLHSRRALVEQAKASTKAYSYTHDDLFLIQGPMHWIAGFAMLMFCLYSTMAVEFSAGVTNPATWFWRRMQDGDITVMLTIAQTLIGFENSFHEVSKTWTQAEHEAAMAGTNNIRVISCGNMAIPPKSRTFWEKMRSGRPLNAEYGMTEAMLTVSYTFPGLTSSRKAGCVGRPLGNVKFKLDENDQILVKSSAMFTRYISEDPNVTRDAFDPEGYFKTGDVGKVEGGELYILGRASTDVIRFSGWKIFGPEVERALMQLDFVRIACVVAVPDEQCGQKVGALIATKDGQTRSLSQIRTALIDSQDVNAYKLPTLLRILSNGETIPATRTGKLNKRDAVSQFFNKEQLDSGLVEILDLKAARASEKARPFDWAGIQNS